MLSESKDVILFLVYLIFYITNLSHVYLEFSLLLAKTSWYPVHDYSTVLNHTVDNHSNFFLQ